MYRLESIGRGPSLMLSSLRPLSDTLTDLRIEYGHYKDPKKRYRLCDFLEACPNLASIRMDHGDIDMSSVTKTYPNLVKLQLWNTDYEVKQGNIPSLLQPFPQLRFLKISPVLSDSDVLPIIDQHCPLLQQLIFSGRSDHIFDISDTPERSGLRALYVYSSDIGYSITEDDIVRYMMKHSETLEALGLVSGQGFHEPRTLLQHTTENQQVTFNRLRQINYPHDADESLVSFLLWIIQHAPNLESVETVAGEQQTRIMQELIPTSALPSETPWYASPPFDIVG